MKTLVVAGLALGALVAPAAAADMPVKAPPPLCSVGPDSTSAPMPVGVRSVTKPPLFASIREAWLWEAAAPFLADGPGGTDFIGGGQAGYNWQTGRWVLGLETDIQGADINGSDVVTGPFSVVGSKACPARRPSPLTRSFLGSAPPGDGWDWRSTACCSTRPAAWPMAKRALTRTLSSRTALSSPSSASATMTGWTAGGGLEYSFLGNWSAKFEGMFYDLGTITTSIAAPHINGFSESKSFKIEGAVARVGVNWHFGGLGWYGL